MGLLLLSGACASLPTARTVRGATDSHPGFDVGRFPGETLLRNWRQSSPYRWIGYYLPAPCHRETSWVGARPTLERLGWGVAILYVGQQQFEGDTTRAAPGSPIVCSRTLLTADRGRADAADAVQRAQAEGFAPGSVVFLDVERVTRIGPEMTAYHTAWTDEMLRLGRFVPGTYAHRDNASALYALAQAAYLRAGRSGVPPFWVAGGGGFSLDQRPFASGFPFASVWQGVLDQDRTWGGVTLRIDENVATRPSPSAPLGQ